MREEEIFFNLIKNNCKDILDFYSKNPGSFLYHGAKRNEKFFIKTPKENRKPKDTPEKVHNFMNEVLNLAGFSINRENSIFVTGGMETASRYGEVYVCFPEDGFKFLWSKRINDFTKAIIYFFEISKDDLPVIALDSYHIYVLKNKNLIEKIKDIILQHFPDENLIIKYSRNIKNAKTMKDLRSSMNFERDPLRLSEISYFYRNNPKTQIYLSEFNHFIRNNTEEIFDSKEAKEVFARIVRDIYEENKNLKGAIFSTNEIMLRANKIYMMRLNLFRDMRDLQNKIIELNSR